MNRYEASGFMCSAFKFRNTFGRNFDYEQSYDEEIIIVPKDTNYNENSYIGIGSSLFKDVPLLYDGMNDKGLCVAGLAFTGNAKYYPVSDEHSCPPSWKFTSWVLGLFDSVQQFKNNVDYILISDEPYTDFYGNVTPNSDLHWLISDGEQSVVVESTSDGLKVYDNPYDVLTNNPPFDLMEDIIEDYSKNIGDYPPAFLIDKMRTRGMETYGLSGGYTSLERFERLSYLKSKAEVINKYDEINTSFHLLQSVEQLYGATPVNDKYEYTIYSAVYDTKDLSLYVRCYDDLIYKEIIPVCLKGYENLDEIYRIRI